MGNCINSDCFRRTTRVPDNDQVAGYAEIREQFPSNPIRTEHSTQYGIERPEETYQSGQSPATSKTCQPILNTNNTTLNNYDDQHLLCLSMVRSGQLKRADKMFRAAIRIDATDYRGWKGLSELLEDNDQTCMELLDIYLTMLTFAKPKSKSEWIQVCDKALALHIRLNGKQTINNTLQIIKSSITTYPNFENAAMGRWRDLVYSFSALATSQIAKVDEIIMKTACRVVRDCPQTTNLDKMKCDILLNMSCNTWAELEAECISMHGQFPFEALPMKILAKHYIKTDINAIEDRMLTIYGDLHTADNSSPLAALGFGQVQLKKGEYQSAISFLTKGVAGEPQNIHGWLYLALAQLAVNNMKECQKASVKGLALLKKETDSSSTRSLQSQFDSCRLKSVDPINTITSLVDRILAQPRNTTPRNLYQKLKNACKCIPKPRTHEGATSLQRAHYTYVQQAKQYWQMGINARADPVKFLTSVLNALKHNPWNAEVFFLLGRYLWEISVELRLAMDFLTLSYNLDIDGETCAYLVDICMALQEEHTARQILTTNARTFPNAKWRWLRLGLMGMRDDNPNQADQCFRNATQVDSSSNRQSYECLGRNCLRMGLQYDAARAFDAGTQLCSLRSSFDGYSCQLSEAADLRAIYSDTDHWTTRPQEFGVQFAFSILYAIGPDLLRPIGFDFNSVSQARMAITKVYKNRGLYHPGKRIDWGEADKQCSYMLRFFLIHCQFVPELLWSYPPRDLLTIFPTGNQLRVCCIGGGPGSDIIGLLTFLRSVNRSTRLTCHVFDKYPDWMKVWETIQPRLPPPSVDTTYSSIDIISSAPLDTQVAEAIHKADIITFVKSVSPAAAFLKNQSNMPAQSQGGAIPNILRTVKRGALVLYIDNSIGHQNNMFLAMAKSAKLRELHNHIWQCDINSNVAEYNAVWGPHGCRPCSSCTLQGYIFDKP